MRVRNVHERRLPVPASRAGSLLDRLAADDDPLWPAKSWPPMRFDGPLAVGARGGHGPVRYRVAGYAPGRSIEFLFEGPRGFDGRHRFEIEADGETACILRHALEMRARGPARLSWPLAFRPMHDALVEDAFAQAEASLGLVPRVLTWSPWVRLLRWLFSRGRAGAQTHPEPCEAPRA